MKLKYIFWKDDDFWLGYLEEYPDYWTQGTSLEDLQENLKDINIKVVLPTELINIILK